jgi:HEAT repeat protein
MIWELVWLGLSVVGGSGAVVWGIHSHKRGRLRTWREIAAQSGLRVVDSSGWVGRPFLQTKAGSFEVRFEQSRRDTYNTLLGIAVPGPQGFNEVRIRRERQYIPRGAREIELGDPDFDSRFFVEGPPRLLFLLFDAETRRLLTSVDDANQRGELEVVDGEIRTDAMDPIFFQLLPTLLEMARRFAQPVDAARRLAENATLDPAAGVRLQNLRLLIHQYPGEPGTVETLRAACADISPEVRLWAGKELGAEGRDVLLALAEGTLEDSLKAQAVSFLGQGLSFERAVAILTQALRRRRLRTARACLEALSGEGAAGAVDVLAKVVAREEGELAVTAARALGGTGSPAAEAPLLQALQRDEADLQVAAASALGRVGSVASVPALKEVAERFPHPELRRATRQAIAEIQSRLPGASPGQLSLAGEEAGQLSLAEAEAGQLSLAAGEGGQLSLPE